MSRPPSRFTIDFDIPAWWTPEQALVVFDLLDHLRQQIWNHYQGQIRELLPEHYGHNAADKTESDPDDLPF
jgi:hypothetical protein